MGVPSPALRADTDTFDVLVELLAEIDAYKEVRGFYDRVCEGLCRLTSMERAVIFLYDPTLRSVQAVGSRGIDPGLLEGVEGTLEETPVAQRALVRDRVAETSGPLEKQIPERYARYLGLTTLTCTPVSAGGRWLGVIFADRGGGEFDLTPTEQQTMWTLGKLAALAASVLLATVQGESARRLSDRMSLTREIHERVIQRLFGLLLVLGADRELSKEEAALCHDEIREVLRELRSSLGGAPAGPRHRGESTLREILDRADASRDEVTVSWTEGTQVPSELEPLAQSVALEALRNAEKHAEASSVQVMVDADADAFVLEIVNDGVRTANRSTGLGLRLATIEALEHSGIVEFGPLAPDRWHVRLVVPPPPGSAGGG